MQYIPMRTAHSSKSGVETFRFGSALAGAIMLVPLLCFAVNVITFVTYGVDMPFMDDWRAYQSGQAGSFDLRYLFHPANDTLYPVGLFLDSVAQRLLHGNSVAYQLLSLTLVLGSLLFLQWRLLRSVLRDRLLAACAFSATLFMLQPDSYWGLQDMAYHQAVPLALVLFALHVVLVNRWHAWLSPALLLVSGAVSGMIYISGAFAILMTGFALLVARLLLRERAGPSIVRGGVWLTLVGIATSIPQLWVIVIYQKGTHRPDAPMAYPTEADFWFYLLGKIGRSLMLPMNHPGASLVVVVLACAALAGALLWSMHASRPPTVHEDANLAPPADPSVTQAFVILLALAAAIGVYLAMVAAGRTNLRPGSMSLLDIFSFAFVRFHYFWVTLLWPWLFAIVLLALQRGRRPSLVKPVGIAVSLMIVFFCLHAGVFGHRAFYTTVADLRISGIKCIHESIAESKPILCGSLLPAELSHELQFAERINASFTRTLGITEVTVLPIDPNANVALALGGGDVVTGNMVSPRGGNLTAVGLFLGNYGGRADGSMSLEVCSVRSCARASRQVSESVDNDFFLMEFADPLATAASEPLSFSFSVSSSSHPSHPVAAWLYPSVEGSVVINGVRRGTVDVPVPGKTIRVALHYGIAGQVLPSPTVK